MRLQHTARALAQNSPPPASSRQRTASRREEPHLVRLLRSVALPEPRAHVNPFRVGDDDLVALRKGQRRLLHLLTALRPTNPTPHAQTMSASRQSGHEEGVCGQGRTSWTLSCKASSRPSRRMWRPPSSAQSSAGRAGSPSTTGCPPRNLPHTELTSAVAQGVPMLPKGLCARWVRTSDDKIFAFLEGEERLLIVRCVILGGAGDEPRRSRHIIRRDRVVRP